MRLNIDILIHADENKITLMFFGSLDFAIFKHISG